ncbi:MAG: hypothetical protein HYZ53_24060 [Planctomycetes bacterium]|nr:hypothetical protein [Planctomycetota bacterium]
MTRSRFRVFLLPMALLVTGLAWLRCPTALAAPEDVVAFLHHKRPEVRAAAARLVAEGRDRSAIEELLEAFRDESDEGVRLALANALRHATRRDQGSEYAAWRQWFDGEGQALFPPGSTAARSAAHASDFPEALRSTESWVLILAQAAVVAIAVAIFGMFVVAGYRLRKMNDITRRADAYVTSAEEIRKQLDGIQRDVEARKEELFKYFARLKEENEAEIEGFSDVLERNVEHRMREVTMALREKAERELEQTLEEVREESLETIRKASQAERERILGELRAWEQEFKKQFSPASQASA